MAFAHTCGTQLDFTIIATVLYISWEYFVKMQEPTSPENIRVKFITVRKLILISVTIFSAIMVKVAIDNKDLIKFIPNLENQHESEAEDTGSTEYRSITFKDRNDKTVTTDGHETGLDFLISRPGLQILPFNNTELMGLLSELENWDTSKALGCIETFITILKSEKSKEDVLRHCSTEFEYALVSGVDGEKPSWCFHPYKMIDLVKVELHIYDILSLYHVESSFNNELSIKIESYLNDFEQSTLRALTKIESKGYAAQIGSLGNDPYLYVTSHPTLVYRMIRRFAIDMQPIFWQLEENNPDIITKLYEEANPEELMFPTNTDLMDAIVAMRRIQQGHNLDTYQLARGIMEGVNTEIQVNAVNAMELAGYYWKAEEFDMAIQWLHFAQTAVQNSPLARNHEQIGIFLETLLTLAIDHHNSFFDERVNDVWAPSVFDNLAEYPFRPELYERRMHQLMPEAVTDRRITEWNWAVKMNFRSVCAGRNLQTEEEKKRLKCWYDTSRNLYWRINPLKMEQLNEDPPVFQAYNFIGEHLMEEMKRKSISKLKRSLVTDRNGGNEFVVDNTRTSTQSWFDDDKEKHKFLRPLTRKFEFLSGLVIRPQMACDSWQVAVYGPSHYYAAHLDAFEDGKPTEDKGNRITTIMGYLNDVTVGGRTGFPVLGVYAEPVKGSVVMWNNLKRNGKDIDNRTWHGGCPVVLGVKWITNKWVYYNENAFTFKCTRHSRE